MRPGQNVWRRARASRASVLIDGAAYFLAVRKALLKARRCVFIIGWDISSQTRLVGPDDAADDGWPATLVEFLIRLVEERPELSIHILAWDYSILYAVERELFPYVSLGWNTPDRIKFCLDNELPIGCSHHQKIVVVDDALAFVGGLDLTARRWDTSEHKLEHPGRVDPDGVPYRPFHDVQMMVDGVAAKSLGALARGRWVRAGQDAPAICPIGEPWPAEVDPDFVDVEVGIARTVPPSADVPAVREVEALFHDAIDSAERTIYVENQFLTCAAIAHHIATRLHQQRALEAVFVTSGYYKSWLEARTMHIGNLNFMRIVREAGVGDRARFLYPRVSDEGRNIATTIHAKVMIVDDRFLRIGSANLNNRSMGTDTECDLAIEADHAAISRVRNALLGHHCGVDAGEVAAALARTGSLIAAAETLSREGHQLRPLDETAVAASELPININSIADPDGPFGAEEFFSAVLGERLPRLGIPKPLKLALVFAAVVALSLAWFFTPLAHFADPAFLHATLASIANAPFPAAFVIGGFLLLELVAFPVNILIAATAATFGPVLGFVYAASGALISALVAYGIGVLLGKETVHTLIGSRIGSRIRRVMRRKGVLAVAAIRLVPIAPFALVNIAAGALKVPFFDFLVGTVVGMAPGILLMSALGHQLMQMFSDPSPTQFLLLVVGCLAWIGMAFAAQAAITKYLRSAP